MNKEAEIEEKNNEERGRKRKKMEKIKKMEVKE